VPLRRISPSCWPELLSSFSRGTIFGISIVVTGKIAPPKERAVIFYLGTGLTVSNVLGAPSGMCIGQSFGWWIGFAVVAVAAVCILLLARFVPTLPLAENR